MMVALNPAANAPAHPANVDLFCDFGSVMHVAVGAAAGALDPQYALLIFAIFLGYQLSQASAGQSWSRTGGEVMEFALGMGGTLAYKYGGFRA